MSERLLFELKAVDNASAPLRQVQNELQRTAGIAGGVTKDFRKFALGGLQQAGFQVGDFAVQLANGTNQMQAMGQQLPQLLQIFGPIGSAVGAAVAVFAAYSVIMEKTAANATNLSAALKDLNGISKGLSSQMDMLRFGVDTEAEAAALKEINRLQEQMAKKRQEYRDTDSLGTRLRLAEEIGALQKESATFELIVAEIDKKRDALAKARQVQDGLLAVQMAYYTNIGNAERDRLKVADDIGKQMLAIQMANYTAMGNAERDRLKVIEDTERERLRIGNDIGKQMLAIQMAAYTVMGNAERDRIKSLENGNKLLFETLSKYTDIGGAIESASKVDLASVFSDAISPSSVLYQFAKKTFETMVNMSKFQPQDYSGFVYGGMLADRRMEGSSTPPQIDNIAGSGGGGGGSASTDAMKTLRDQLELEVRLIGKSEAQQRVIQALGEDWKKYSSEAISGLVEQINSMDELNRVAEMQKQIADSIKSSMEDAFMGIVDGTSSVKDAFRSMAADIIKELYRVLVVQQMVGQLGTATQAGTGLLGGIGRLFGMRAMGGPVTGGKPYMVGERGPEIIVPSRNGNVIANNQLGGGGVTVVQNINITTGVQQTVRAEIRSLMPQIADSAKRAVLDAKQRGGSYGSAFA